MPVWGNWLYAFVVLFLEIWILLVVTGRIHG